MCQPRLPTGWFSSRLTTGTVEPVPPRSGVITKPPETTCFFFGQLGSAVAREPVLSGAEATACPTVSPFALNSQTTKPVSVAGAVAGGVVPRSKALIDHSRGAVRWDWRMSIRQPLPLFGAVGPSPAYPPLITCAFAGHSKASV